MIVVRLLPVLVVNLINLIVPQLVVFIVAREQYEFENWEINQRMWRMCLLSISNTLLLMLFYLQELSPVKFLNNSLLNEHANHGNGSEKIYHDKDLALNHECIEDTVSFSLQEFLLINIVLKLLIIIFGYFLQIIVFKNVLQKSEWRADFYLAREGVWLISLHTVQSVSNYFTPILAIVYPILLYIIFKAYKFKLFKYSKRPMANAPDESTSLLLNRLNIFNSLISKLLFFFFFQDNFTTHNYKDHHGDLRPCSPFDSENNTFFTYLKLIDSQDTGYPETQGNVTANQDSFYKIVTSVSYLKPVVDIVFGWLSLFITATFTIFIYSIRHIQFSLELQKGQQEVEEATMVV